MRKYFFPLFVLAILIGTSCQPKVNVENEKEAIMAVLQEESDGLKSMDKGRIFATHIQDSEEVRLELGVYGYNTYQGWDEIESLLGDYVEGGQPLEMENSKENVILKVTGNSAWLTCDNVWKMNNGDAGEGFSNIQIVFLEKVKGEWKISFTAYYSKPVGVPGINEEFK